MAVSLFEGMVALVIPKSAFGLRLWRLLSARCSSFEVSIEAMAGAMTRQAGMAYSDLEAVIGGAEPAPEIVRQLGPMLGIHDADMFVIAGLPVPVDLAAAWQTSPWDGRHIIRAALRLDAQQRAELDALMRSLPEERPTEFAPPDGYPDVPGALLLRLLRNRNMRPHNARLLAVVGGGPYVSDSTVAMLGTGRVVMTAQYVTAFAHLLGFAPQDMVALAGVGPVAADARAHPASAEIAALAWNARRFSSDQIKHVVETAKSYSPV
jgi:hypothetical protein